MKKIVVLVFVLAVIFAGCTTQQPVSPPAPVSPVSADKTAKIPDTTKTCFDEIGKTFNSLKQEQPNLEFQAIDIIDAAGECLGAPDGKYYYFFFGTQSGPSLEDLCGKYGDELKCAGIASTVGEIFAEATEQIPIEQFFKMIGVAEYTYFDDPDDIGPETGWIVFGYNDMQACLSTHDEEFDYSDFQKVTTIKLSYTVIFTDNALEKDNLEIQLSNYDMLN